MIYVLTGEFDYEGGTPIGVYSSLEKAEFAAKEWRSRDKGYHEYHITSLELDSLPEDYAQYKTI